MLSVITPAEMGVIDAAAPVSTEVLIARAGWAVATEAKRLLGGLYGRRISVVAGKGNNGAGGRVGAELLRAGGARVHLVSPDNAQIPAADLFIDAAYGFLLSVIFVYFSRICHHVNGWKQTSVGDFLFGHNFDVFGVGV